MSVIKQFIVQRYIHKGFGNQHAKWSSYSWETDVAKKNRKLMDAFKKDSHNEDIAMRVLKAVSEVRSGEKFRIIERIVTTEENYLMEIGPRKQFTLLDLYKLAKKPVAHDGVRDTNENVPAIKEAGLDPCYFGALPSKLVLFAIDHLDNPPNEWILVHPESHYGDYKSWDHNRVWWNLAEKAYIKLQSSGIDSVTFMRVSYGDDEAKEEYYKTFASAVSQNKRQKGHTTDKNAYKTFPKKVREL